MKQPKVLVGCPTSAHKAYCLDKYLAAVKELTYPAYAVVLVDNSKGEDYYETLQQRGVQVVKAPYHSTARERIAESRNILRQYVFDNGYDYFLSLEQDVIPPKDIIERLLKHEKPVVAGVYYIEYAVKKEDVVVGKKVLPLLYKKKDAKHLVQLTPKEVEGDMLLQLTATGLGCILIHRDVLEKISFRYEKDKLVFDDIWFCQDLEQEGIPLYVDSSIKCLHLMRGMDWDNIQK